MLAPSLPELIARARADLRMGVPVVLQSRDGAALAISAEGIGEPRLQAICDLGEAYLAITARRAETLKIRVYGGDVARVALPKTASLEWIASVANPADDLTHPMKGPFNSLRDCSFLPAKAALDLAKSARLLPACVMVDIEDAAKYALDHNLTLLPVELSLPLMADLAPLNDVVSARVPLAASEAGKVHIFRPEDGGEEHFVVEIGKPDRSKPVLARLHSACFTGDILGSLKCDCGPQLNAALGQMGTEGAGILLYLNQEGRGIGHANKMRAYSLQDQGFDTVEANHRLGFEDDERDFRIGAAILKEMGFSSVRLLTNNPGKIARMEEQGIKVTERVALKVGENAHNTAYLATKAKKSGHLF